MNPQAGEKVTTDFLEKLLILDLQFFPDAWQKVR